MQRWNSYRAYLERTYGFPVYRVGVDAGFSCPNRNADRSGGCVFCDPLGASAVYQRTTESTYRRNSAFEPNITHASHLVEVPLIARKASIREQVGRGLRFIKQRYKSSEASLYFQAYSNTFAPPEELGELYRDALTIHPWREFIVSTRPDCITEEVVNLLISCKSLVGKVSVELGLQSASDATLCALNRGHDVASYSSAADMLHRAGIPVTAHIILGLPGEDEAEFIQTAKTLNETGIFGVKIHNLHIPVHTNLYETYRTGEISTASTRRHVFQTIFFLRHLDEHIVIERLICETPAHRLAAPRTFDDKSKFLKILEETMVERNICQGDLAH